MSEFYAHHLAADGTQPHCKTCQKRINSDNRRKRKIVAAGRPKPRACEICERESSTIVWDHCHVTGLFRGWICSSCNTGIGHAQENVSLLRRMADYLEQSGAGELPFPAWKVRA